MRRRVALALAAAFAVQSLGLTTGARTQSGGIPCENFAKNPDGSWTVLKTTYIEGPNVRVNQDVTLQPGYRILGYDVADMITKACPNAKVALPSDETPNLAPTAAPGAAPSGTGAAANAAVRTQPPPSLLARYADANGNIDIRQLTCGHLNEATPEESQLLLAWYSGWYNGLAKGHGINLARVRYKMRNVVDYCRVNRDKRLTDAMEEMLK
ncbi:MAG: HdeA/HdeB family chaperone [Xanthobacteraceae bacterium]|jgi:hypothetical protein